ncbi:MAG: hypothetical protein V2A56_09615 [bacterium]
MPLFQLQMKRFLVLLISSSLLIVNGCTAYLGMIGNDIDKRYSEVTDVDSIHVNDGVRLTMNNSAVISGKVRYHFPEILIVHNGQTDSLYTCSVDSVRTFEKQGDGRTWRWLGMSLGFAVDLCVLFYAYVGWAMGHLPQGFSE